jgi:hypothetical protein
MPTKKHVPFLLLALAAIFGMNLRAWGQSSDSSAPSAVQSSASVPRLVRFSGEIRIPSGKQANEGVSVTFALHKEQEGSESLWMESQNVQLDTNGRYTVLLGASSPDGLPVEVFTSGEARWLSITPAGEVEQPRVLLVSAPYALKAGDAETLGGRPASAYALAEVKTSESLGEPPKGATVPAAALPTVTGSGTLGSVPLWRGTNVIGNSVLSQAAASIGIGTPSPATTLDVNGAATIRGNATITGTLTASHTIAAPSASYNGTNTSQILNVTQRGTGTGLAATTAGTGASISAISGFATASTGVAKGVLGLSGSNSGVGVEGVAGSFGAGSSIGVNGIAISSTGTGVNGGGWIGVQGSGNGVGGLFQASQTSALVLKGENLSGLGVFSVDAGGNLFALGSLHSATLDSNNGAVIGGNAQRAVIGDPGCGAGYAGIGFGPLSGCTNYSMIGNGQDTFVNRPAGGAVHFRENNGGSNGAGDQMVITTGGAVGIGTSSPNAQLDVRGGAGNSGFGISTDGNAWQAQWAGGFIKAMAFIDPFTAGGIAVVRCYNSQMTGAAVTTPPCGITIQHVAQGSNTIDFGFRVTDRFVQVTPYVTVAAYNAGGGTFSFGAFLCGEGMCSPSGFDANQVNLSTFDASNGSSDNEKDVPFFIFVY